MISQLQKWQDDVNVSVVVLTGSGKHFCSGMDLSAGNQSKMKTNSSQKTNGFITFCDILKFYKKPIVAKVNGAAVGKILILYHCMLVCFFVVLIC
jgi:enoyl-CoA hydratase/carnithine racemase